jgi:hypothetical protein
MEALVFVVLLIGAMAAAAFEIWLAANSHPRRFLYAWSAWTPLAVLALAAMAWSSGP